MTYKAARRTVWRYVAAVMEAQVRREHPEFLRHVDVNDRGRVIVAAHHVLTRARSMSGLHRRDL